MSEPIYGPGVPSAHLGTAIVSQTSRQTGGMIPVDAYAPDGIRSIITPGSGHARSEAFYSPAGEPGRTVKLGDSFTWSGTFTADLGPARRTPGAFHILWQLHPGVAAADISARLSVGTGLIGVGGRDYAGGGAGSAWWTDLVAGTHGDVIEHSLLVSMVMSDQPGDGNVHVEWDGQVVKDSAHQTWPDAAMGVTGMIVRAGIYRGPADNINPRAQSNTWRDVNFTITTP